MAEEQKNFFHSDDRTYMKTRETTSADFDRFWEKYPRHTGKLAAKRQWDRLSPSPELVNKIVAALEWQCRLPQWQDEDFVPHASTYLHNARWEDEPPRKAGKVPTWECPHVERCDNAGKCRQATILDRPRKAHAS